MLAAMFEDLTGRSAVALAAAVRRREVSPVELVEATLARIERDDGALNSIVTLDAEVALAVARQAETRAGDTDAPALLGVPVAIKDLSLTRGLRTTFGTRELADFVPDSDDEPVARLRAAGMVLVGKTNVPELGTLPWTESELLGPCRNPWDTDHTPGGSSGGSAAALAAGLVPAAHGSDGAGSIRIPASNCGLVGLKPSRGRVSNAPLGETAGGFSTSGTLARHVEDVAALLDAMSGPALGDAVWAPPPARPFTAAAAEDPPRLRVALVTTSPLGPFDPEVVTATEDAARLLEELGHRVEPAALPLTEQLKHDFTTLWSANLSALPLPAAGLEPYNRSLAERGAACSAPDMLAAWTRLRLQARRIVVATAAFDVVVSPTLARPPLRIGELAPLLDDPVAMLDALTVYVGFTPLANVTGQPSISLPLGRSAAGLPLGTMATARPGDEATLLSLAGQLQRATDWAASPLPALGGC